MTIRSIHRPGQCAGGALRPGQVSSLPDLSGKFLWCLPSLRKPDGLLLHNLGVLDHIRAISSYRFARHRNRLRRQGRQFRVKRLVLADEQVRLAVARFDTDRQAHFNAGFGAISVFGTGCFMVEIAGHVDDLAGYGDVFGCCSLMMFPLVGEERGGGQDRRGGQGCYNVWLHAANLSYARESHTAGLPYRLPRRLFTR
jgi:hypothetical protein